MSRFKEYLRKLGFIEYNESSLSRILVHKIFEHDTGTITAYRNEYTHKENQQRTKSLKLKLLSLNYQITSVKGSFIENYNKPGAKEVGEHVFFVCDWKNNKQLEKQLVELGEEFEQDSVLYIPKGGKTSFLIGTKEDVFPGYHVKNEYPIIKLGKENEIMTRVKGRPFFFTEEIIGEYVCANNTSRGYHSVEARKHWSKLEIR